MTFINYYKVSYLIVFKWNINEKRILVLIYFCIEFIEYWCGKFKGKNDDSTNLKKQSTHNEMLIPLEMAGIV